MSYPESENKKQGKWGGPFPWSLDEIRQYVADNTRHLEVKGHYVMRAFVAAFSWFFQKLSWNAADKIGGGIGWLIYALRIRRHVAMTNLDIAFGDTKTREEKLAILKESVKNVGRNVAAYLRAPALDEKFWLEDFTTDGLDRLREAYNMGKGMMFVGAHIGVWEFAAGRVGWAGYPIALIAKKQSDPVSDKMLVDARVGMLLGTIPAAKSMDRIMWGVEQGEGVISAIDQNMRKSQGMFVDWMGHVASTLRSLPYMVKKTGVTVLAGWAIRKAPGKFHLEISEIIPWVSHPEDEEEELKINLRNYAAVIEKVIREHPEQWLWLHRRYKRQPDGMKSPYEK
ncbi:MAG: hypothetical protein P9L99_12975 [Candidatus Lernaella stagnicola]|nr:hypothetical protein [Candidatus Lernaella stagnicola]